MPTKYIYVFRVISQQYVIIYLHKIKKWVLITEMATVYCTVGSGSKYNLDYCISSGTLYAKIDKEMTPENK